MPEFTPAKKLENGGNITQGLQKAHYPTGAHVRNADEGQPMVVVEFEGSGGVGVVLSIQSAAVLGRDLRRAVHAYLNPEPVAESDSQETE